MFNYIENIATTDQLKELYWDLNITSCARMEWADEFCVSSN